MTMVVLVYYKNNITKMPRFMHKFWPYHDTCHPPEELNVTLFDITYMCFPKLAALNYNFRLCAIILKINVVYLNNIGQGII